MEWLNLNPDLLLAVVAAAAFVAGVVFARFVLRSANKRVQTGVDRRDHQIRQLEADLRVAERRLEEYTAQLETKSEEFDQSMATVCDLNALLDTRNSEVEQLRKEVKGAVKKTRELRRELTDRAEETLREHVRAKEVQDELDVVRAGSDAIISEFSRLQHEDDDAAAAEPSQQDLLGEDLLFDEDDDRPTGA